MTWRRHLMPAASPLMGTLFVHSRAPPRPASPCYSLKRKEPCRPSQHRRHQSHEQKYQTNPFSPPTHTNENHLPPLDTNPSPAPRSPPPPAQFALFSHPFAPPLHPLNV